MASDTYRGSPFTPAQLNALNHYVLTGRTSLLDPSNRSLPLDDGYKYVYSGEPLDEEESCDVIEIHPDEDPELVEIPQSARYRPPTPVPDPRSEPNEPVNISRWRLAIPQGCHPPDDAPWSSHASITDIDDPARDDRHRTPELKPGPDITLSSTVHSTLPDSQTTDVNQWRYENFVDWWKSGVPTTQGSPRVIDPPSTNSSLSDLGNVVARPPPPPTPPRKKTKSASRSRPSQPDMTSRPRIQTNQENVIDFPSQESLTKVYYRLQTHHQDPLPVRDLIRNDKSVGVLFLDDRRSYRVRDLKTLIFSRECSHTSPISPCTSFFVPCPTSSEPPLKLKLRLYYNRPDLGIASAAHKDRVKLEDDDILPRGVGSDEPSALVVEILVDGSRYGGKTAVRAAKTGVRKCGKAVAVVIRGLAVGATRLGEGLASFADCIGSAKTAD